MSTSERRSLALVLCSIIGGCLVLVWAPPALAQQTGQSPSSVVTVLAAFVTSGFIVGSAVWAVASIKSVLNGVVIRIDMMGIRIDKLEKLPERTTRLEERIKQCENCDGERETS